MEKTRTYQEWIRERTDRVIHKGINKLIRMDIDVQLKKLSMVILHHTSRVTDKDTKCVKCEICLEKHNEFVDTYTHYFDSNGMLEFNNEDVIKIYELFVLLNDKVHYGIPTIGNSVSILLYNSANELITETEVTTCCIKEMKEFIFEYFDLVGR